MRHVFERSKLTKNNFLDFFQQNNKMLEIPIKEAQKILNEFLNKNKIKLNNRDSWILFMYFEKTKDKNYNINEMAKILFDESEKEFFDRQIRKLEFITPINSCQNINLEKEIQSSKVPSIIKKLENDKLYQKKTYFEFFKKTDFDNDGKISHNDLINFTCQNLTPKISEKDLKEMINYFDPKNKGFINYKDFFSKLYLNVENSDLSEKENQTNIMYCKQFDSQQYLKNYVNIKNSIKSINDSFKVKNDSSNCKLIRFLYSKSI